MNDELNRRAPAQPEPAAPGDPLDMPLPCDIKIGNGTHRKGTSLRGLVLRMESLHHAAFGAPPSPEQQAANLAALQACAAAPTVVEPAPGWCKHCQQYTIDEPLPSSADADWLRRVAVLAGVWPAHDESNCPAAILTAIEKYHTAMVTATPPRAALTETQIEDCIDVANRKFNGRRQGPCGQQMTTYNDWKYWLVREVEAAHGITADRGQG